MTIIAELGSMKKSKIDRSEIILDLIMKSDLITIEGNNVLHINQKPLDVKVSTFLYILQQHRKKINIKKYSTFLNALNVSPHLVANIYAKQILESSSESDQEFYPSREEASSSSGSRSVPKKITKKQPSKRQIKKRPIRRNVLSFRESKKLDQLYFKGPASYGSVKSLQAQSKLPLGKVQSYLETKPSFTRYRSIRLKFPRLKVFVKDINENWSLDLAHGDKLSKHDRNVKYLLVAVDCVSRYLRVQPMKTKYATEAAEVFKK